MKKLKRNAQFLVILLCLVNVNFSGYSQSVNVTSFAPSDDSLRGKLLFITECHEVRTNYPEYLALITQLTSTFDSKDTLNVFVEAPFTMTYFINQYVSGKNRLLVDSVFRNDPYKIEFYFALRKLKKNIRFIGADFEYDQGNPGGRLEAFKLYFDELQKILGRANIDQSVIRSFNYGIRVQGLEEADFFTFKKYIQKISINQTDTILKAKLKEANFVLAALQSKEKTDVRDKAYYSRMLELFKSGITVNGNYNLMIFGSAHGNPYNEKCIYSKVNASDDSPFKDRVAIFANIYLECLSYGSYNTKSITVETVGLYSGSKEDKQIIEQIRKEFKSAEENSFTVYKNNLKSDLKDVNKVIYWGVHNKVK